MERLTSIRSCLLSEGTGASEPDRELFDVAYRTYFPRVYRYLRARVGSPDEAADLAQDVFVRALVSRSGSQPGRGQMLAWLIRIARNCAIDRVRAAQRWAVVSLDRQPVTVAEQADAHAPGTLAAQPDEEIARAELRARIAAALQQLPEDQRAAVVLVDIEGLPYEDAARVLSVPTGTLKSRLSRARARLRALLLADERARTLLDLAGVGGERTGGAPSD